MSEATVRLFPAKRCTPSRPWVARLTARLLGGADRPMVAAEGWSTHLLRDIGLADYRPDERQRPLVVTHQGWPIR